MQAKSLEVLEKASVAPAQARAIARNPSDVHGAVGAGGRAARLFLLRHAAIAEVHVVEESRRAKRTVTAPTTAGRISGGRVLSVEVGPDEEVEWIWSHDRERGSHVTGYKIVARVAERPSRA